MEQYQIKISRQAYSEIEESKDYYNLQKEKLGDDFKNDIFITLKNISFTPSLYPNIQGNIKRCLLHRFPFSIFYVIKEKKVIVLSISHQHRKPRY